MDNAVLRHQSRTGNLLAFEPVIRSVSDGWVLFFGALRNSGEEFAAFVGNRLGWLLLRRFKQRVQPSWACRRTSRGFSIQRDLEHAC
jgi:hypothetical protein